MGTFTKIPQNTFDELQVEAGVLLNTFDPENPAISDSAIITATTGGITVSCVPEYEDFGEDVDNCPNNLKEMKRITGWASTISTSAIGTSPEMIKLALGAADITAATGKITPRADLSQDDFQTVWWVGDRADGGLVAVKLINALSTGGFSLKTTKKGKGNIDIELTGHVSINAQTVVPMEFYSLDGESTAATYTYTEVTPVGTENPVTEGWYVLVGDQYQPTTDTTVDANVTYFERSEA